MPNQVVHFEIIGTDPARLRAYYRDLFGWTFQVGDTVSGQVSARTLRLRRRKQLGFQRRCRRWSRTSTQGAVLRRRRRCRGRTRAGRSTRRTAGLRAGRRTGEAGRGPVHRPGRQPRRRRRAAVNPAFPGRPGGRVHPHRQPPAGRRAAPRRGRAPVRRQRRLLHTPGAGPRGPALPAGPRRARPRPRPRRDRTRTPLPARPAAPPPREGAQRAGPAGAAARPRPGRRRARVDHGPPPPGRARRKPPRRAPLRPDDAGPEHRPAPAGRDCWNCTKRTLRYRTNQAWSCWCCPRPPAVPPRTGCACSRAWARTAVTGIPR